MKRGFLFIVIAILAVSILPAEQNCSSGYKQGLIILRRRQTGLAKA
jgi:hypothetical protein